MGEGDAATGEFEGAAHPEVVGGVEFFCHGAGQTGARRGMGAWTTRRLARKFRAKGNFTDGIFMAGLKPRRSGCPPRWADAAGESFSVGARLTAAATGGCFAIVMPEDDWCSRLRKAWTEMIDAIAMRWGVVMLSRRGS
jgi:hypothetical protein